jgi:hypothetical protein
VKQLQTIIVLLLLSAVGLSGCDQVKDLATETAEKAKQDVVSGIAEAINGGEQDTKKDAGSSKDSEAEKDEEK